VSDKASGLTLATAVYEAIRLDILEGRCAPDEKLQFDILRDRYKVGISPIREALSRLHSDGWVAREERRGYRVATVSRDDLMQLVRTRVLLEGAAIREALANPDSAAEEVLILAFHRLSKEPRYLPGEGIRRNPGWMKKHRQFHLALVAGCKLERLRQYCEQLFDAAERYRLLAADSNPERREKEEHRAMVEAYLAGDAAAVTDLLAQHYQGTVDIILQSRFTTESVAAAPSVASSAE
jgi:DNA-binding GntR family transcriptional regulator